MSTEKKYQRPKTHSRAGWQLTIVDVLSKLRKFGIYDYIEEVIENEDENAAVFIISHNRFFSEHVTINRLSVEHYHINHGADHFRARTAKDAARIIRDIIIHELPPEEDDDHDNMRYMRKTGNNRR